MQDKALEVLLINPKCGEGLRFCADALSLQLQPGEQVKLYDYSNELTLGRQHKITLWAITDDRVISATGGELKSYPLSEITYVTDNSNSGQIYFCNGFLSLNYVTIKCEQDVDLFLNTLISAVNAFNPHRRQFQRRDRKLGSGDILALITFVASFFALSYFQIVEFEKMKNLNPQASRLEIKNSQSYKNAVLNQTAAVGGIVFCVTLAGLLVIAHPSSKK